MRKKLKKYLKKEYGVKKLQLPNSLAFLNDIKFHAIIEDYSGSKIVRTIEIKPPSLKALIDKIKKYEIDIGNLEEICSALEFENDYLKGENSEIHDYCKILKEENEKIRYNYEILYSRSNEGSDEKYVPSPKSYFNVMSDSGTAFNTKPIQGGLPSLGKRK